METSSPNFESAFTTFVFQEADRLLNLPHSIPTSLVCRLACQSFLPFGGRGDELAAEAGDVGDDAAPAVCEVNEQTRNTSPETLHE
jgi:hypothetical protein